MFETFVVEPVFNLLVAIYGVLPGNNFGLSLVIFTIVTRLLMWPLVKKQLHQAKAMRQMQPEIKKIKKAAKGDRQKESAMLMELYKERGISPFGSIGTLIVQLIILIGLYSGIRKVVDNPQALLDFSYSWIHGLPGLKELARDMSSFDSTFLGFIDLKRAAIAGNAIYYPGLALVLGSAVAQFYQTKQLMPEEKDQRSLRTILKDAGAGKQADQAEVNAAVGRSTRWIFPIMIILFTISLPAALSLYWFVSGLVAFMQQRRILGQDEKEMEAIADSPDLKSDVIEGEIIEQAPITKSKTKTTVRITTAQQRRKR